MEIANERYAGESPMSESPEEAVSLIIGDNTVSTPKLQDLAVTTEKINNRAVTPEKLSNSVQGAIVTPITNQLDSKYSNITSSLDNKFTNKTNELYSMIVSIEAGGVALSQAFGDNTDIGISQKTLTKALGKFYDELSEITGKHYTDFTLTVVPTFVYSEQPAQFVVMADASDAVSDFDNIKIYVDDVLVAESGDLEVFTTQIVLDKTSEIKAVGIILGRTTTKTVNAIKEIPFFMGSGINYQDAMTMDNHKTISGSSLEGDYDLTVKHDGEHMFIIIPASRKNEFRRANMKTPDMGGYEIPLELIFENQDYVVYKSQAENGYIAGTYSIDININS